MLEWGPTWKLGTKMAKAMHPWRGGQSSWTRAPVAWIVDVFNMENGGHMPAATRKRLQRREALKDWAPFDEEAIPIPTHHRPCMPEDPDEEEVNRAANGEEDEEEDNGDEGDDDEGQHEMKKQQESHDEPDSDPSDDADSAPLRKVVDSAAVKRKRPISKPRGNQKKQTSRVIRNTR